MKTYHIDRSNGTHRTATSLADALRIARELLGVSRVYRGAEYQTDRPASEYWKARGLAREYCTGLDIWTSRKGAAEGSQAPVVISW